MKRNEKKWSDTTGWCSKGTGDIIECTGLIDKDSI